MSTSPLAQAVHQGTLGPAIMGHVHRTTVATSPGRWSAKVPELLWDSKHSVRVIDMLPSIVALGTYHRMYDGTWRRRVKRRVSGGAIHTWKKLKPKHVPKRIEVEMLLLGVL